MAATRTLSPSADRLGAALRALRQTDEGADPVALGAKCLRAVIAELASEGVSQEDLKPLVDLEASVAKPKAEASAPTARNRRRGGVPSDTLLARISAVIDLLIKAGHDDAEAAQIAMRRLVAAGVPPPLEGGDARGWRRLLEWRNEIAAGLRSHEAREEYKHFTREIEAIPANERLTRVLDGRLWDRRRGES